MGQNSLPSEEYSEVANFNGLGAMRVPPKLMIFKWKCSKMYKKYTFLESTMIKIFKNVFMEGVWAIN